MENEAFEISYQLLLSLPWFRKNDIKGVGPDFYKYITAELLTGVSTSSSVRLCPL